MSNPELSTSKLPSSKTLEKKRLIIQAALAIFDQHGIENTTVDMLCLATGTSIGSLYHHFGNKEGLAVSVYLTGLTDFSSYLLSQLKQTHTTKQAIFSLVDSNIDWISQHPLWAKFIFEQAHVLKAMQPVQGYQSVEQEIIQHIQAFEDSQTLQYFPAEIMSSLIIGSLHTYARQWLNGQQTTCLTVLKPYFRQAVWQSLQKAE